MPNIDWTTLPTDFEPTSSLLVLLSLLLVLVVARSVARTRTARTRPRRAPAAGRTLAARGAAPGAIARRMRIAHDVATLMVRRETGEVTRGSMYRRRPLYAMGWKDAATDAAGRQQ